jgi:hypothetical protein
MGDSRLPKAMQQELQFLLEECSLEEQSLDAFLTKYLNFTKKGLPAEVLDSTQEQIDKQLCGVSYNLELRGKVREALELLVSVGDVPDTAEEALVDWEAQKGGDRGEVFLMRALDARKAAMELAAEAGFMNSELWRGLQENVVLALEPELVGSKTQAFGLAQQVAGMQVFQLLQELMVGSVQVSLTKFAAALPLLALKQVWPEHQLPLPGGGDGGGGGAGQVLPPGHDGRGHPRGPARLLGRPTRESSLALRVLARPDEGVDVHMGRLRD